MENYWWIWFISRVVKYQSLLGAMVGSFFAAFIAYLSIRKGFRNQKKLEDDKVLKEEQKELLNHKGVLTTLYVNLQHHYMLISRKRDEFNNNFNQYKNSHKFTITNHWDLPSTDLLKKLLFRFIEYKNYDRQILSKLTIYFALLDDLFVFIKDATDIELELEKESETKEVLEFFTIVSLQFGNITVAMEEIIDIIEKDPEIKKLKDFNIKDTD